MAYGAVAYLRQLNNGLYETTIIAAKSRVAPSKAVSIPRLELMAACLAAQLAEKITKALELPMKRVTLWSDSFDVLFWVREQSRRYKTFVANRIGTIQTLTQADQWQYVPTKENPADLLSRGVSAKELTERELWWHGPTFLKTTENWPVQMWNVILLIRKGGRTSHFLIR